VRGIFGWDDHRQGIVKLVLIQVAFKREGGAFTSDGLR
jgi:hypothetical protein